MNKFEVAIIDNSASKLVGESLGSSGRLFFSIVKPEQYTAGFYNNVSVIKYVKQEMDSITAEKGPSTASGSSAAGSTEPAFTIKVKIEGEHPVRVTANSIEELECKLNDEFPESSAASLARAAEASKASSSGASIKTSGFGKKSPTC